MSTRRFSQAIGSMQMKRMFATAAPKRMFGTTFSSFKTIGTGFVAASTFTASAAFCWGFNTNAVPPPWNYDQVVKDIDALLDNDITIAPVLIRLAWHEAGTFDKNAKGEHCSNSASMRFHPECAHGANAGLKVARDLLEPIKKKHPQLSYADLWVLASIRAIDAMGGPAVPFRWGRQDARDAKECAPDGRLPDATKGEDHIRDVFYRMGFNDQEIVALIGAHTVGECHADRSGFIGPWAHDKLDFTNSFFTHLLDEEWVLNKKAPKLQFADKATGNIMMLPADVALIIDPKFRVIVEKYAKSQEAFHKDFAAAYQKLMELGTSDLKAAK